MYEDCAGHDERELMLELELGWRRFSREGFFGRLDEMALTMLVALEFGAVIYIGFRGDQAGRKGRLKVINQQYFNVRGCNWI